MRERARAVCGGAVEDAAVVPLDVVLGSAVEQHIHVRADVHVAQLEGAGESEDKRDVFLLGLLLADHLDVRGRARRQAAGQGRVAVDVEFEEVEERIADHGDGAVLLAFDAVVKFERVFRLVADREGDPLDLVRRVLDVFARFAGGREQAWT